MKIISIFFLFLLQSCASIKVPSDFIYKEIKTSTYTIATWQKISNTTSPIRIYAEGDGYAFNKWGEPTSDPTPKSFLIRKIAFQDNNPNVVYMARPCQYVQTQLCTKKSWSTGRFSKQAVIALYEATKHIAKNQEIIYIGYSGGALLSGLVIENFSDIKVKKWVTIAGLLNHELWTRYMHLFPLTDSMNLVKIPTIPQKHYIGEKDDIIPLDFMLKILEQDKLCIIPNATHNKGLEEIIPLIYAE